MAKKKILKKIKVQVPAGKATPAPPLGPALGQAGINIGDFVTKFNAQTQDMIGNTLGVAIVVYEDRSYDFVIKTPPAHGLLMKAAGIEKGSGKPNVSKVGKVTRAQVKERMEELGCKIDHKVLLKELILSIYQNPNAFDQMAPIYS